MPSRSPAEAIFVDALKKSSAERVAFLDQQCDGDDVLRQEVESLLADNASESEFLDQTLSQLRLAKQQPRARGDKANSKGSSHHGRFLPGTVFDKRYRIVSLIGRGGMGEVYRADDLRLGQTVALKFLPEGFASDSRRLEYFHKEVRLTRQISHPNVCRVYDIGEVDGQHFLSMEYIDGEDLRVLLRRIGRLPEDKGTQIAQQLCAALAAAHDKGVLHRDLKPANIMIDGRGQVRIADFGLARLADEGGEGEIAGTPAYMAPEQSERGETSIQSDLYSLGLILAELFLGDSASDNVSRREKISQSKVGGTSGSDSTVQLNPLVQHAITRCLQEQPSERPGSARELAAVLPGGDPLEAAIATGVTPSPELVANAVDKYKLRLPVAICLLMWVLLSVVIASVYARHARVIQQSPEVLSSRCLEIMNELGFDDLPANTLIGLDINDKLRKALSSGVLDQQGLDSNPQPSWQFWRRWTHGSFVVTEIHNPEYFAFDGPTTETDGNATVVVDGDGNLLGLKVLPATQEPVEDVETDEDGETVNPGGPTDNVAPVKFDWNDALVLAGIDPRDASLTDVTSDPDVYCDDVIAWTIGRGTSRERTIQAGTRSGKLVYFEQLGLSDAMSRHEVKRPSFASQLFFATVKTLLCLFVVLVAWRNGRSGRGDWRGANRLALTVIGMYLVMELSCLRPNAPDFFLTYVKEFFTRGMGHALLHGVDVWMIYFALEPYVRRFAPRSLVGVARVLEGRWRDGKVGQEVLTGVASGCLLFVISKSGFLLGSLTSSAVFLPGVHPASLLGTSHYVTGVIHVVAASMLLPFMIATVLVAICLLLRRPRVDMTVGFTFGCLVSGLLATVAYQFGERAPTELLAVGSQGFLAAWLATRIGFLAIVLMNVSLIILQTTLYDTGAWYAAYGTVDLMIPLLIAIYGFVRSQGGWSQILRFLDSPAETP